MCAMTQNETNIAMSEIYYRKMSSENGSANKNNKGEQNLNLFNVELLPSSYSPSEQLLV